MVYEKELTRCELCETTFILGQFKWHKRGKGHISRLRLEKKIKDDILSRMEEIMKRSHNPNVKNESIIGYTAEELERMYAITSSYEGEKLN